MDPGASWLDTQDGSGILVTASAGVVNPAIPGTYTLTYQTRDSAGNLSNTVNRTVIVTEPTVSTPSTSGGG